MAYEAFAEHCLELLESLGHARAKRMFGGHGLYVDDLFIAIIAQGKLFLKTSDEARQRFIDAGGQPFIYDGPHHKPTTMASYWTPPAEALESPALMEPWARLAIQAAVAARKPDRKKKTRGSN
jgi:DNA transformation protein